MSSVDEVIARLIPVLARAVEAWGEERVRELLDADEDRFLGAMDDATDHIRNARVHSQEARRILEGAARRLAGDEEDT